MRTTKVSPRFRKVVSKPPMSSRPTSARPSRVPNANTSPFLMEIPTSPFGSVISVRPALVTSVRLAIVPREPEGQSLCAQKSDSRVQSDSDALLLGQSSQ
mmetsp:Transcript_136235/g.264992  ORF Transcript_136235/g.264992 Transcript_136235/m.264992 type:complete len:100 (+) Transcript_136235:581-880(+)